MKLVVVRQGNVQPVHLTMLVEDAGPNGINRSVLFEFYFVYYNGHYCYMLFMFHSFFVSVGLTGTKVDRI